MNAPKLRFENNSDWVQYILSEVSDVRDGTHDSPKYVDKGYPLITSKNLTKEGNLDFSNVNYLNLNDYNKINQRSKVDINDILFGMIGTIGNPVLVKRTGFAIKNVALIKEKGILSNNYLIHYLKSPSIAKQFYNENKGGTQKFIALNNIRNLIIFKPQEINEEKRLISFFDRLDSKIQLQQEKIDLLKEQKNGFMQKIFSRELRFKDEHGDDFTEWKTNIKADELFESVSNKDHNGDYPVLSATQDNGIVYRDTLERHMSFNDDNLKSYKLVEENDFIISLRSFQGGIEFSTLQGLVSPAYTVFRKKNDSVYNLYFAKVFKTANFITRLSSTTYGIRDGKAISYKDFSALKFDVPSIEEQKKVAQLLDLQDRKISIEEEILRELQNQKQAFMQQMFI